MRKDSDGSRVQVQSVGALQAAGRPWIPGFGQREETESGQEGLNLQSIWLIKDTMKDTGWSCRDQEDHGSEPAKANSS
jgi:hypothetical protein